MNAAEAAKQAEAGIKTITFDAAGTAAWSETAQAAGWAEMAAIDAAKADALRACLVK